MNTHAPMMMPNSRVHHFKLVLLGDTAVGKSCLVVRFVRDEFFEFQEPTIGGMLRKDENYFYLWELWLILGKKLHSNQYYCWTYFMLVFLSFLAAFLTQTVALDDATVKFEIWWVLFSWFSSYLNKFFLIQYSILSLTKGIPLAKSVIGLLPRCIIAVLRLP